MENSVQPIFTRARRQTDESLNLERGKADDSLGNHNQIAENKTDQLVKDTVVKSERLTLDKALEEERGESEKLLNELLEQERRETDWNLQQERKKTDLVVELSAKTLKKEKIAHSETKSELTTREEFVAIVSHDLKNPIGTILMSTQILLEEGSAAELDVESKKWIEIIKRNAATSLRLISDILDMERVVDGKILLSSKSCQLHFIIQETLQSYDLLAKEKSITLLTEFSDSFDLVSCDKDRISQVLSNLVGNAIKFSPDGGTVVVGTREFENHWEVYVKDSGPGVPKEQTSKIFEKFTQLGNRDRTGIGLGLYISKMLIESHLGKLWVDSAPGAGSTFIFTLPKAECREVSFNS